MVKKTALKINKHFYYGWIILVTATLAAFFSSPGQTYSISAFINHYINDFGYSRTYISTIYSIATVLSGLLMIFMGRAVDRFGSRRMLIVAGVGLAMTTFFNSAVMNIPMIFIGFFFLRFFGQGSLTLIPGALVPQWFEKRRAFALSIVTMGNILGNLIVPVLTTIIIASKGWRFTWQVWGVLLLVVFIPWVIATAVNKPEDIGLLPDNRKAMNEDDTRAELERMELSSFSMEQAVKTLAFWAIGFISMIVPLISTGMMFHFYSLMGTKNVEPEQTAFVIGLVALPGLVSPLFSRWVIDRYRPRIILLFTLFLIAADMLFMLTVESVIGAMIFIVVYGLVTSIQNISINVLWVQYFGRKHLGSIRGAATVFSVVGSAFGTIPFGLSFDLTGSYSMVFVSMAILAFGGMILAGSVHQPVKK